VQILSSQIADGGIDVQLDLSEPLSRARIDPEKFRQVLMNLMLNAIQAMDGRGKITVSTAMRRGGRRVPPVDGAIPPSRKSLADDAEQIEVSVRDTGPGISPKVLRNLFVPFFTTKAEGTGLGLAISQSIVQNNGGTIEVHSQPGAGTTFTIVLPLADDVLATPTPTPADAVRSSVRPGLSEAPPAPARVRGQP
jgi:two-component system sensor histidine kinase HydH